MKYVVNRIIELIKLEATMQLCNSMPQLRVDNILFEYKHRKIIFNVFGFDVERDSEFSFPFTMDKDEYNFNKKIIHSKTILSDSLIVNDRWARKMVI